MIAPVLRVRSRPPLQNNEREWVAVKPGGDGAGARAGADGVRVDVLGPRPVRPALGLGPRVSVVLEDELFFSLEPN